MDSFTKEQKDEFACSFAIMCLYDGSAEITPDQIFTLLNATGNTKVEPYYPLIFCGALSDHKTVAKLISCPSAGGIGGAGGGGGGGDAPVAEKEEEKVEEEEMDMGGGMDMFGNDDAGGGDY